MQKLIALKQKLVMLRQPLAHTRAKLNPKQSFVPGQIFD